MGATGHSIFSRHRTSTLENETFNITNAVNYKGSVPPNSGLEEPGANRITLKIPATDGNNILFQFKLSKDSKMMTIIGYKDGVPEVRCKVAVDSGSPSLDRIMASGSRSEKLNAIRMKDLFSKSTSVKENQLSSIANKLLQHKKEREGNK